MAVNWPPHALVELTGGLAGSGSGTFDEIFACGLRVVSDTNGFLAYPDEAATAFATKFASYWGNFSSNISAAARLREVKVNNIMPDGTYKDPVTISAPVANVPGNINPQQLPAFVCVAYSWTTAVARGSAHAGRIYLPNAWQFTGGGSVINGSDQTTLLTAAKAFLSCITTAVAPLNGPMHPAIVSPGGKKIGPGMNRITGVRVGRVIDVQRRRKGAIGESYVASTWP